MVTSPVDSWDRVRQSFADQFEQSGRSFVYRRSQKGAAINVSPEERDRFVEEFDRSISRSKWMIYSATGIAIGGIVLISLLRGWELSQLAVYVAIGLVMIPYLAYYRWAWTAPARQLEGRTPIAGERSPDEVRKLRFRRMTYGQLATAGFGGLLIPFIGAAHHDIFFGWGRLWLALGGALALLAAVQAFRKWRFEQDASYAYVFPAPSSVPRAPIQEPHPQAKSHFGRYFLLGAFVIGLAFISLTPAGKQLAQSPGFMPLLMIGLGGWSLFTVAQGIAKGEIEPFARGFYNSYEREKQPKRFWASMAWNSIFGCLCLWLAFELEQQAAAQPFEDRCYNSSESYSPQEAISACTKLLGEGGGAGGDRAGLLASRGIAYDRLGDSLNALTDYSAAIRLNPGDSTSYYNRGYIYQHIGEDRLAIADFNSSIRLQPDDADSYFNRGFTYEHFGNLEQAIADYSQVIRLKPKNAAAYFHRGQKYKALGKDAQAAADFAVAVRLDPALAKPIYGPD